MADGTISKIQLPDNTIYDVVDNTSGYMTGMTILSYGSSTWQNFIDAYSSNKVVYCRASSSANPASGSQTRLAFMAYVNNAATPTEVEFQYYRSVSTHTESQQGDQVFVYKLNKTNGWSVTTREASVKVVAGTGLGGTYSNGTMTLTGPTKVSDLINDSGFISMETDPTVPSWAKQNTKPSYSASEIADNVYMDGAYGNPPYAIAMYGLGYPNKAIPVYYYTNNITDSNQVTTKGYVDNAINSVSVPTKTSDLVNDSGFITGVTSTATPTLSTIAEFDSSAKMNSTNMTSSEVTDFVESLDISGGGGSVPTFNTATITLTTAGWSNSSQTVTVQGVTASNIVIVNPAPASYDEYVVDNVRCTGQGANSLTFTCDFVPDEAITVSVIITSVTAVYGGEVS